MRKSLLIGLVVCLLALGGIGAAFARADLDVGGVQNLNTGKGNVPKSIAVDYVGWTMASNGVDVEDVILGFNADLKGDVSVQLTDSNGDAIAGTMKVMTNVNVSNANTLTVDVPNVPIAWVYDVTVTIAQR